MDNKALEVSHIPVLLGPVLDGLQAAQRPDGVFVDSTLGAGGHCEAILQAAPRSRVIGFDRDPAALALATARLTPFGERFTPLHASYTEMGEQVRALGVESVDGILIDLGVSSMQLDQPERGFAFRHDGPLDMRFDPTATIPTASDLVNTLTEGALADILFMYGEETDSRRIARAIIAARPLHSTKHLADVIYKAVPGAHKGKIHPATRSFQALRIAVNDELGAVERVLPIALNLLKPGGRLAVISFHSLEDRIVKHYFRHEAMDCICPPKQPICTCGHRATITLVTRKPISGDTAEIAVNPRARSAQLRIAEKVLAVNDAPAGI